MINLREWAKEDRQGYKLVLGATVMRLRRRYLLLIPRLINAPFFQVARTAWLHDRLRCRSPGG